LNVRQFDLAVEKLPERRIEVRAAGRTGKISDVFGRLKQKRGPALSIEETGEIAARGWAGKRCKSPLIPVSWCGP
jgi:hypothetical protein